MDVNDANLEHLPRDECMRLLASVPVGRIVYTRQALPAVALVNFALLDGDILIRVDAEDEIAAATRGAVVAFEADRVDTARHAGWSVTVVGHSRAVTSSAEIQDSERVALTPWMTVKHDQYIRVSPTIVHGRRLSGAQVRAAAG
jgi:uncharacterized protein